MKLNEVATEFAKGLAGYWLGVQWLFRRPSTLILLLIPWTLGVFAFAAGIYFAWTVGDSWVTATLMKLFSTWQESAFWEVLYAVCKGLLWFSILLLCLVSALVVAGIAASPVYEVISIRVEEDLLGKQSYTLPWSRLPKLLLGEALKGVLVVGVPLVMFVIPGLNLFAGLVAAFMLGWNFYDFPLARRGWGFRQRWSFVRSEFWAVLGFGIWLVIPVVQMLLVPMAVAGGTILNIEALKRRGLLSARPAM